MAHPHARVLLLALQGMSVRLKGGLSCTVARMAETMVSLSTQTRVPGQSEAKPLLHLAVRILRQNLTSLQTAAPLCAASLTIQVAEWHLSSCPCPGTDHVMQRRDLHRLDLSLSVPCTLKELLEAAGSHEVLGASNSNSKCCPNSSNRREDPSLC